MKDRFKALMTKLEQSRYAPLLQFVKFGLVGVSNTAISYGIEMLCYYVLFAHVTWAENTRILITSILAFVISVTNSYFWNNRFVFKSGKKTAKEHLHSYLKTMACYAVTGLVISPAIKMWLSNAGVAYWLASLLSLLVTIPLNYVLNKYWAFGTKKGNKEP